MKRCASKAVKSATVAALAAFMLYGCSEAMVQNIRSHDFRANARAAERLKQTASPISNVFDMPDWTTDLEGARAFAAVNGQKTVLFFYREAEAASDTAKTRLNALSSSLEGKQKVAIDAAANAQIAAQFGVRSTPTYVVLDPAGNAIAQQSGDLSKKQIAYLLR
jgi:thioredoxin-like negative regulator of GroEL